MRFYYRTGRRNAVSYGWLGAIFVGLGYLLWWSVLALFLVAFLGLALLASVAFFIVAAVAAIFGGIADQIEPGLSVESPPRRFGEALGVLYRGMLEVGRSLVGSH